MTKNAIFDANTIFPSFLLPDNLDFSDLPWNVPVSEWPKDIPGLEEIQHGITRHPVVFINSNDNLYVIKEMPGADAIKEYGILKQMTEAKLPCVYPIGYLVVNRHKLQSSVLFTRFLDASVPYRSLFISRAIEQFQNHLLDAIAGLLVQIHLNGFYWGDCSLSNILFRRDAGALQAYLVDAETTEYHLPPLSPMMRYHDLEIMQENIHGELSDLKTNEYISLDYPTHETGSYIQQRYRNLWEIIMREDVFSADEQFRVNERIRALNSLGFSVKDIEIKKEEQGNKLKLRIFVSDRNFHKNQLSDVTGLEAEDHQAQQIMNEIQEIKANMANSSSNITLEEAANFWLVNIFKPVADKLQLLITKKTKALATNDIIELYCQVLEHKWYLSERAYHDVGHQVAVDDYIYHFG